ncbi:unnamed protein product [Schistosoma curassoni]|uniref:Reverse transcriptase domain-containing protein n=1 Tax=Schistosoma curassoni TaxID=6186 RepID=A0A183K608_9TREM|nr:unnamed protein product [Schistosoma curassoni]
MQLDDLDFSDDLALLSQTQQQMQEKTNSVAAASAAVGLNIHKGKSRIFRYNTACTNPITIDGEDLEDVKTFAYLGSVIDEPGELRKPSSRKYRCLLTIVYARCLGSVGRTLLATTNCGKEQTRSQRRKKSERSAGSG